MEDGRLHDRDACDAKGALAAQVAAVERLPDGGEGRVGLRFVVGKERGSDGARAADEAVPPNICFCQHCTTVVTGYVSAASPRPKARRQSQKPSPAPPSTGCGSTWSPASST